jgi:hypothetical protein
VEVAKRGANVTLLARNQVVYLHIMRFCIPFCYYLLSLNKTWDFFIKLYICEFKARLMEAKTEVENNFEDPKTQVWIYYCIPSNANSTAI